MEREQKAPCRHHFLCPPPWTADQDGTVEAICRLCGERRRLSVRLPGPIREEGRRDAYPSGEAAP